MLFQASWSNIIRFAKMRHHGHGRKPAAAASSHLVAERDGWTHGKGGGGEGGSSVVEFDDVQQQRLLRKRDSSKINLCGSFGCSHHVPLCRIPPSQLTAITRGDGICVLLDCAASVPDFWPCQSPRRARPVVDRVARSRVDWRNSY